MLFIFYIFLAFIASFIGAMSGVGGGVIIKPVLDLFSGYDPSTISVLSSLTVFSMAIVSLIKSGGKSDIQNETWSSPVHLGFLGFGSVIGGLLGETLFDEIITLVESDSLVKIIQNIGLLAVTFGVFIFMLNIHKVPKYKFTRRSIYLVAGICLGTIAAFLGIGGGPLNVAAVIFLFSFDLKTAMFSSILIIFFSQCSKLCEVLLTGGFSAYDLTFVPYMIVGAVVGSFIGALVQKNCNKKTLAILFNGVQILIICLCIVNIIAASL